MPDHSPAQASNTPSIFPRPLLVLLFFAALGFTIYSPSLRGERVWDDHYLVGENPFFRSPVFAAEVFCHHLFFESASTYYRPVQNLSYIADYWLWAGAPLGYHCTNVALHVLAAWLLWLLLRRLMAGLLGEGERIREWSAFLVGLVWLVHPAHNAAVAYISGRADSLAAVFALGAWLVWWKARDERRFAQRVTLCVCSLLLLLLALCSKEIALIWLVLFTLHTLCFERTPLRSRLLPIAGVLVVLGVYLLLHSLPPQRPPQPSISSEPLAARSILALRALGDYTGLLAFPATLMMERSLGPSGMYANAHAWERAIGSEWLSILGLATILVTSWLCAQRGAGASLRRLGALWFGIAFIPISNLIPLNAESAEHWIYLASVGALMLIAGAALLLPSCAHRAATLVALLACAAFAVRTSFRAADWADAETFARKTIASGGATPRMLAYLAQELGAQGHLAEQEQVLRKTLVIFPDYTTARTNLALCLRKQGRESEAAPLLVASQTAAPTVPRSWNAALNIAGQLHRDGRSAEALAMIREWRPRFPETWELAAFESTILRETHGNAIEPVAEYARAHWWHLPAQLRLASLQRDTNDFATAAATLASAQKLDVHGAAVFGELALLELARQNLPAAIEAQAIAVARAPRDPAQLQQFADILEFAKRPADAAAVRKRVEKLRSER